MRTWRPYGVSAGYHYFCFVTVGDYTAEVHRFHSRSGKGPPTHYYYRGIHEQASSKRMQPILDKILEDEREFRLSRELPNLNNRCGGLHPSYRNWAEFLLVSTNLVRGYRRWGLYQAKDTPNCFYIVDPRGWIYVRYGSTYALKEWYAKTGNQIAPEVVEKAVQTDEDAGLQLRRAAFQ